jgi:hypothetical protein
VSENEAIHIVAQFIGWLGLLAMLPFLYRFVYAFSYYVTGRLKKHQRFIVQRIQDGAVISETEVSLDSKSPIVKQLDNLRGSSK